MTEARDAARRKGATGLLGAIDERVRSLYPGYFALVMATGIVSNAFWFLGFRTFAAALLIFDVVVFPLLVLATCMRAVLHPRLLWADLVNPRLVFTFFTIVAAADVLGLQLVHHGYRGVADGLWVFALVLWFLLIYFSFAVLAFLNEASEADVVHGGWLIAIVGTESLVLLGVRVAPDFGSLEHLVFVATYVFWGVGIFFYGIFVTLFSYRIFFARLIPADMNPLFWVIMGAAAIATNAGSALILAPTGIPFLESMHAFIDGSTLIIWAWATWWIPLLVIFGIWRHVVKRHPLAYHPMYWSLVFPLGMYTVATYRLALAADFTPLQDVARVMVWVAFAAWLIALAGLAHSLVRGVRPQPESLHGLGA